MASSASSSTNTPKISMFKAKSGFVIPKNKLSGSLVPTFKGGKKPDGNDSTTNDSTKQMQRKTRWAPDLSQDAVVRRGRALAYQTRVDQITQQLKSGSLTSQDDEKSTSTSNIADDRVLTNQTQKQKLQELEFEKREAISEILKLNPSYKAPPHYKPNLKEATVPIPVKERPGYNFVGLVLGSEGENQKRLEKETGARVQVYGTKFETKEKVQVMASDGIEALSSYDELFFQITAETYDKVDAAVALIELLLASILGKPAVSSAPVSGPGDDVNALSKVQDLATSPAVSTAIQSQGFLQPVLGPMLTSQGQLPQYTGSWFQSNPSGMPSLPVGPNSSSTALSSPNYPSFSANPSTMPVMFVPRPAPAFGSGPQNMPLMGQRAQPPAQGLQRPFMLPNHPLGHTNLHGNNSIAAPQTLPPQPTNSALSSFPGLPQPRALGLPMGPGPSSSPLPHSVFSIPSGPLHDRPMPPAVSSAGAGWVSGPGGASSQSVGRPPVVNMSPPMVSLAAPASGPLPGTHIRVQHGASSASVPSRPFHGHAFTPSQIRPPSMQGQPFAGQATMLNSPPNPQFGLAPSSSQLGVSGVGPRSLPQARFPPGAMGVSAPRPPQPSSGDFTFQPHRPNGQPSHTVPGPSSQGFSPSLMRPPPPPQAPSFQPPMQNPAPRPLMQNFPRPQVSNTMGHRPPISPGPISGHPRHFGPSNMNPQMGPGNMNPATQSQMASTGGSFPPRPGMQQSYSVAPFSAGSGRSASNPSGAQQVYDPFSPTSAANAPQMQGGNPANVQKQDNDPEYEDLMASVGVK